MAELLASLPPAQAQAALKALLNGPAAKPPDGTTPNFIDPKTLDAFVILTLVLSLTLTAVALVMKLSTKTFIIRSTTFDDYFVVLAWLGEVGMTVPIVLSMENGGGVHTWDLQLKRFFRMLYYTSIWTIMYAFIIFLVKLSILLQYLKIFVPTRQNNKVMFASIHTLIWSCFVFYVVTAGFQIGMCSPRKKFWEPLTTPGGHCFDYLATYQASAIFNVVSDFAILFLPMVPLWRLRTSRKKRLGIMAVFGTGIFACVASILRTYYTWKITKSLDISYNTMIIGLWAQAEISTGILICCLPVTPRFFQYFGPRITKTLSFFSRSSQKSEDTSKSGAQQSKKKGLSFFKSASIKHTLGLNSFPETWAHPFSTRVGLGSGLVTLDEYTTDAASATSIVVGAEGRDLEYGPQVV